MTLEERQHRLGVLRVWCCCGLHWELILHGRWPERRRWGPRCRVCGEDGELFVLILEDLKSKKPG